MTKIKNNNFKEHQRRSIRLNGYDYAQNGIYFITICVQNRACLLGDIIDQSIKLNAAGKMIETEWKTLPKRFNHIQLDEFIVMPNHFHGIIIADARDPKSQYVNSAYVGAPLVGAQDPASNIVTRTATRAAPTDANFTLGNIIGAFKSITTYEYINGVKNNRWLPFEKKFWQRNYYEHIIRNVVALDNIREYIINNPMNWQKDEMNPCYQ